VYEEFNSGFTLTPSHFLTSYRKFSLCPSGDSGDFQINKDSAKKLLETWKKAVGFILEDLER